MKLKLVAVAVAALVPVVAMLAYNEVALRRQKNEEMRIEAAQAARLVSSEVERIIEGLHSLLVAVSAMPSVSGLDVGSCTGALRSIAAKVPSIRTIFVIGLDGKMICGSMDAPADADFSDSDYFRAALETKDFVVGTFTRSRISGAPVLPVAMPLLRDGVTIGAITTGIRLEWLQDRITERDVARGNAITIADHNGMILSRVPLPDRFVGTRIPDTFQHLVHAEKPGILEVTSQDGTERILGYRPIALPREPLYVSAGLSKAEAFASINQATLINSLSILGGALLSLAAAIFIGNRFILSRIFKIADVMEDWRAGNVSARTGMRGGDELATVGATLDRLLDELDCRRRRNEQADEERSLLSRELAHRVKNSFMLVQAVARQSFRRADPQAFNAFAERLQALAGAFDILLKKDASPASIRETVKTAIRAHQGAAQDRFELEGPEIMLSGDMTLSLSLVIHELSTNATKYGALSSEEGRVSVFWREADGTVTLTWRERGGPHVNPPGARGFGSVLVDRAFPARAKAATVFDFQAEGLEFTLSFMADATEERSNGT